jgi:glycosyltransferase involved in cell wall biosynthesis
VRSVLEQDHDDLEIVITDDSGGGLAPVAEAFGDPRVRYQANPRRLGLAGNHVEGLRLARGRYLGFLHDDDRFLPSYVSSVVSRFEADPSLGVVFADCWIDRGTGRYDRRDIEFAGGRYERFLPHVVRHDCFIPSTTMIRRQVWEEGDQSWPDLVCGDLTLFVDAAVRGWPFYYLDEPLVVYRMHAGQTSSAEERQRGDVVAFWSRYRFEDAEAERLRRHKLARWLVARAGTRLKQGRSEDAAADLRRARELGTGGVRTRERALRVLAAHPALVPAAHRLWRRLRPAPPTAPLKDR